MLILTFLAGTGVVLLCLLTATASANAQNVKKVLVAEIARNLIFAPIYAAREKGFFAQEGLDVSFKPRWSPERVLKWYTSGRAQIMLLGIETAVFIQNGAARPNAKIFASLLRTNPMFLVSRKPILVRDFNWRMLKGKTVIGRPTGRTTGYFFERVLRKNGLDPKKGMNYITDLPVPDMLPAWQRGFGDFVIAFEPAPQRLARSGTGFVVASLASETRSVDFSVLMASSDFIAKHPATIQAFTNAVYRGLKWVHGADIGEITRTISPLFPDLEPEIIRGATTRFRDLDIWKKDPMVDRKSVAEVQTMLIEAGVMRPDRRVPYDAIVDRRFVLNAREKANP